jgi:hypothetical protein
MPSRRLEDRIRELCAKATATKDQQELEIILTELRSAMHEALQRVRRRAIAILDIHSAKPSERRNIV